LSLPGATLLLSALVIASCGAGRGNQADAGDSSGRQVWVFDEAVIGARCLAADLADGDADPSNGIQPDCMVTEAVPAAQGGTVPRPIPACPPGGSASPTASCWRLANEETCQGDLSLQIMRPTGFAPAPGAAVRLSCVTCAAGSTDPRCWPIWM
jgi:hypothetical protein